MKKMILTLALGFTTITVQANYNCAAALVGNWKCNLGQGYYDRVIIEHPNEREVSVYITHGTNENNHVASSRYTTIYSINAGFSAGEHFSYECQGATLIFRQTQEQVPGEVIAHSFTPLEDDQITFQAKVFSENNFPYPVSKNICTRQ